MTPAGLDPRQTALLDAWLPGFEVAHDHSWGLVGTTVLELVHDDERFIVKAGDAADHHIAREITAHQTWLVPWTEHGRAPRLVHADRGAKVLVTLFLAGVLVEGTEHAHTTTTHRQAGELLAQLHAQAGRTDHVWEQQQNAKALRWLDGPHGIDAMSVDMLRAEVAAWPAPPVLVVPTHGDWQPRNWLLHEGELRVIDFGRAELRPAFTDLGRLEARYFHRDPDLEAAFLHGYGPDPRDPEAFWRNRVRDAIGTAAWAHQVGDSGFEAEGQAMLARLLATMRS